MARDAYLEGIGKRNMRL